MKVSGLQNTIRNCRIKLCPPVKKVGSCEGEGQDTNLRDEKEGTVWYGKEGD